MFLLSILYLSKLIAVLSLFIIEDEYVISFEFILFSVTIHPGRMDLKLKMDFMLS